MDFVQEAITKTRRFLRLRDLLLMFLRVAAVFAFGMALSRPFVALRGANLDPHQAVHAVIVVDNSLSMSLEEPGGTLLSRACQRAKEWIDELPGGSRISVVPLCGPIDRVEREAFRSPQEARSALDRIEIADQTETAAHFIPLVQTAFEQAPELKARRVMFFGDQQQVVWPVASQESVARAFPELEVVRISPAHSDNTWVAAVELEDDFAEPHSETAILATIRCEGDSRENVAVALHVDSTLTATQYIDLASGETRVVRFRHQFSRAADDGRVQHVPVTVSLENDRLPVDDSRSFVVPVLSSFPVIFVDQYGSAGEVSGQHRLGETYYLRQLLSPIGETGSDKGALSIRHVAIEDLTRTLLQDARLVVVAGVEQPGRYAGLLGEYVRQGGQLMITAGGEFSPAGWTRTAWENGRGILPIPLDKDLIGSLPTSITTPKPFFLDPSSMTDDIFQIPGVSSEDLDELYRTPVFFLTTAPSPDVRQPLSATPRQREDVSDERIAPSEAEPRWLQWRPESATRKRNADSEDAGQVSPAGILAKYSNGNPFLIERNLGEGSVLLALSGIGSDWNNLPRTNAVVLLDRLVRRMLKRSLPRRTVETFAALQVSLAPQQRRTQFECVRPDGTRDAVVVEALGPDEYGIVLRNLTRRGIYRVRAVPDNSSASVSAGGSAPATDLVFAVNGPEAESNLTAIDSRELASRLSPDSALVTADADSTLMHDFGSKRDFWRFLLWCTLACLLLEMIWLAFVNTRAGQTRSAAGG
jgi:hypothetical protein